MCSTLQKNYISWCSQKKEALQCSGIPVCCILMVTLIYFSQVVFFPSFNPLFFFSILSFFFLLSLSHQSVFDLFLLLLFTFFLILLPSSRPQSPHGHAWPRAVWWERQWHRQVRYVNETTSQSLDWPTLSAAPTAELWVAFTFVLTKINKTKEQKKLEKYYSSVSLSPFHLTSAVTWWFSSSRLLLTWGMQLMSKFFTSCVNLVLISLL